METLADRIAREGPLNELDAVGWAIRLAKRIEGMHALGVTHGSMSPACVLIEGPDRTARAQLVDVRRSPAAPACQSPERIGGGGLSQADDTWALACTLYATLTGSPAFSGADDGELGQKILTSTPAPLAVFDVGDDDLQRILDEAFARDIAHRTTSVAALRAALEEWHPDPNVGALPAVEEEGADAEDDEDEDARTIMRSAPGALSKHLPGFPAPAGPPPGLRNAPPPAADDEDEDERTVMRTAPERISPAMFGGPSRSGAFAAAVPGKSGAFPAGGPLPEMGGDDHDDEEATRMLPTPGLLADPDDDDDEQKTLMRSSLTPEEEAARRAGAPADGPARPRPAAGARPLESPSNIALFPGADAARARSGDPGAAPVLGGAPAAPLPVAPLAADSPSLAGAPLPALGIPGAAPLALTGAAAPVPAPAPRRTALWLALVVLLAAAGATYFFLRMR